MVGQDDVICVDRGFVGNGAGIGIYRAKIAVLMALRGRKERNQ